MIDAIYAKGEILYGIITQPINWLNPANKMLLGRINQIDGYVGAIGQKTATTWLFINLKSASRASYEFKTHNKKARDYVLRYVVNDAGVPEPMSEVDK